MHVHDTKAVILETAARLYADLGYSAVSMRTVASEVGVTAANLYHHFKGKDELIREAIAYVFADKTAALSDLLESAQQPEQKLEAFVHWFVHLLTEDRVFFRLLIRELIDGDAQRLKYLAKTVLEHPFALVRSLARTKLNADEDDFLAAFSLISIVLGHVQLAAMLPHLSGGHPKHLDPDTIADHVLSVLRKGSSGCP